MNSLLNCRFCSCLAYLQICKDYDHLELNTTSSVNLFLQLAFDKLAACNCSTHGNVCCYYALVAVCSDFTLECTCKPGEKPCKIGCSSTMLIVHSTKQGVVVVATKSGVESTDVLCLLGRGCCNVNLHNSSKASFIERLAAYRPRACG